MFLQEEQHQEAFLAEKKKKEKRKKMKIKQCTSQTRVLKMTHPGIMSGMPGCYQMADLGVRLNS